MGNSCRTRRRKSQFKKGSDWWKFSIWNRVMGSQPIRIQLGKFLWEILAGNLVEKSCRKSCGKILWEILVGNLVGNSCRKILQENLEGNSCGKSCGKILWEIFAGNLVGNSCGKILQENLVEKFCGKSCGKIFWEILVGNSCGKFPIPISKPFLKVIFKICNSSISTSFSLVNVKNSFLKPILDRPHGDNMKTMWRQHGDNMGMWRPHGDNVGTTWGPW